MQAGLLVVDNKLLLDVASEVMGESLDSLEDLEEGAFSFSAFLLSLWLSGAAPCPAGAWVHARICPGWCRSAEGASAWPVVAPERALLPAGGRMLFVWDMLRGLCDQLARPLVVFMPDAESLLCGSYERLDAFTHFFGPGRSLAGPKSRSGRLQLPLVLMGGCTLSEEAADLAQMCAPLSKAWQGTALLQLVCAGVVLLGWHCAARWSRRMGSGLPLVGSCTPSC